MKDAMMPKVHSIPLCLADFSEASVKPPAQAEAAPSVNEVRQVYKSDAMIGLAISMGAVGILLQSQTAQAFTTTELKSSQLDLVSSPEWHLIEESQQAVFPVKKDELASPPIEPMVEAEETLWNAHQVKKEAIAAHEPLNLHESELELSVAQDLGKLDQFQPEIELNSPLASTSELNIVPSQADAPLPPQQALDNLRKQREQLSVSLIQLREEPQSVDSQGVAALLNSESEPALMQIDLDNIIVPAQEASISENSVETIETPTQIDVATSAPPHHLPLPEVITASNKQQVYQVQPGDTLVEIAERYNIPRSSIVETNKISNPDIIQVNQQLFIPMPEAESSGEIATLPQSNSADSDSSTALKLSDGKRVQLNSAPAPLEDEVSPVAPSASNKNELKSGREKTQYRHPSIYADSLKADVTRLQQEYRQDDQVKTPVPNTVPAQLSREATKVGYSPQPQLVRPEVLLGSQPLKRATTAAAPIEGENYHTRLQPLEGRSIEPELPPLSSPEQYLPDSPTQFDGYIWPAKGVLTSGYGERWGRMHRGIDIAGPVGTPIVAVAPGEVVSAGWNSGGFGNLVKLKHPDGSLTLYAHNSRIVVHQGQEVEQGQFIAEMGSSGYSTGPHLHFEVHPDGQAAVNPIAYLPNSER